MILILMGVSGCGKTTIGRRLASVAGFAFADADDFHSVANKTKMTSGLPLSDDDREPWLRTLNDKLREWAASGQNAVLACSALKQRYRQALAAGIADELIRIVFLDGSKELFAERLSSRQHEFMNPALLNSQFEALEPPEDAIRVVNDRAPEQVVDEVMSKLALIVGGLRGA